MSDVGRLAAAELLPALPPDLVVSGQGRQWRIERIAPSLAQGLAEAPERLRGRLLERVFAAAQPGLNELAQEVATHGEAIEAVRVRLWPGRGGEMEAAIHPGGLREDYSGQRLFIYLRPLPMAAAEAVETFHGLVGASSALAEVIRKIRLYAASDAPVVITGETGTGKELVAHALHQESARRNGPYVVMNCAAIAEELLESELFGHEKGAFTGALRTHRGRFERADGGSLFLDEIGDMPLHTQSKLLRVLEERRIERVGGEHSKEVDVRVLCATNVALERAVSSGGFRADLYHRVAVLRIHLPPLRSRCEDIPPLIEHFLGIFNRRYGRVIHRLTPEAMQLLQAYLWPGNVRELRNVLERVYVETPGEVIGARAFSDWIRERQDFAPGRWDLASGEEQRLRRSPILAEFAPEKEHLPLLAANASVPRRSTRPADLDAEEVRRAYQAAAGNLSGAARLLGVHRATLYRYLDKLGLSRAALEGG